MISPTEGKCLHLHLLLLEGSQCSAVQAGLHLSWRNLHVIFAVNLPINHETIVACKMIYSDKGAISKVAHSWLETFFFLGGGSFLLINILLNLPNFLFQPSMQEINKKKVM